MLVASLYEWLLFGHIIAAMVWVGGAVLLGAMAIGVLRAGEPDAIARFLRALPVIGPQVLAPATVAVVGLGVWLVLNSTAWDFGQAWVQLGIALLVAAFLIGAAHQSRAALNAQRAVERGDHDDARRHLARWSWGYAVIVLVLVAATWGMVFKPGL